MAQPKRAAPPVIPLVPLVLRDRRSVVVDDDRDLVELRSPDGAVELRIRLTADGPVLQADAARLSLRATDTLALTARRITVRTGEDLDIASDGDVRIAGATIYLN
jgi:hypothetical protein